MADGSIVVSKKIEMQKMRKSELSQNSAATHIISQSDSGRGANRVRGNRLKTVSDSGIKKQEKMKTKGGVISCEN